LSRASSWAVLQHHENLALRDELIFAGQDPFDAGLHPGKETDDVALEFRPPR